MQRLRKNSRLIDSATEAKKYAFKLLGYRLRGIKEMQDRLALRGYSSEVIADVISFLKEKAFVDDNAFAGELFRNASRRGFGRGGVRDVLLKKGIDKAIVEETLAQLTPSEEFDIAVRLMEKKAPALFRYSEDERKKRLWRFLMQRGFSKDTIRKVLKIELDRQSDEE